MKKFSITLALLSLCPLIATSATVSATSANCTVNTCNLKLTAEANPYGILLKWDFKQPGYTARIYRNLYQEGDPFVPKSVAASEGKYLDKAADYMKRYEYNIEISGDSGSSRLTATAYAIRGSGMAPKIEKVEAAQLWLANEGPYNVRVTLNTTYDVNRYEVTRIGFSTEKKKSVEWYKYNSTGIYDISDKFKTSKRGLLEITAQCEYRERTTRELVTPKKGENEVRTNAKVFFHKFGGGSKPNWFEYWIEDGALIAPAGLKFKNERTSSYGAYDPCHSSELYHVRKEGNVYYDTLQTIDGETRTYPCIKKYVSKSDALYLYPPAPTKGSSITLKNGSVIGLNSYGLKCCASTCQHEFQHHTTAHDLRDTVNNHYYKVNISASDLAALRATVQSPSCSAYVRGYYNVLSEALDGITVEHFDSDSDYVLDDQEKQYSGMRTDKKDSFQIGELNWKEARVKQTYRERGDDEYIARKAEESTHRAVLKKDWAFPGSNVASGEKYESMDESTWNKRDNKDKLKQELCNSFGSTRASKAALLTSQLLGAPLSPSDEVESFCERIYALPELSLDNFTKDVEIVDVKPGAAKGIAGAFSQLSFEIQISTKEDVTNNVVLTGWLVDSEAHPVAKAQLYVASLNGTKTVSLNFASADIYIKRGQGYALKCLTLASDIVNGFQDVFDVRVDAAVTDRTYEATEFAPNSGYLMSFGEIQENKPDNLNITVPIEICSNGVYVLSAVLKTEDGEVVAEAFTTNITQLGQQEICLAFSKDDIFLSKQNGPYVLRKVELRADAGECVDSEWNAYTTAEYSYRDFADGSETIFADAWSFRREVDLVGVDGLCDALNFSFAVTNLAPSEAEYVARIYLCGTNDELVCSSTKNVVLSNEVNMVNIPFRGIDIRQRDVEGPYYVSEVAIEDAESGEIVERFKPDQILIDRRLGEFGSSPVAMNGEVTLAEATGGNPFAVEIPVLAIRPGTVTVSAVLVATNGTPVAYAEAARDFAAGETGSLLIRFGDSEINKSGIRGPYYIKYIAVRSGYAGLDELHIDDPGLGVLNRQFTLYVDCAKEDDSGDGLTPATAKATIDGAVIVSKPGDMILVADGVYEPFTVDRENIVICGVNGPQKVIVDGEGVAPCVHFWNWAVDDDGKGYRYDTSTCVVEGMTLRNGYSAYEGGGIDGGRARNCIITGCFAEDYGGGAYGAILENCIVYGNKSDYCGGGAVECTLYNCTVSRNTARYGYGVVGIVAYNSIVWDNSDLDDYESNYDVYGETGYGESEFHNCCTSPMPEYGEGNIDDDPLLAAPEYGNMCLVSKSPCVNAGLQKWVKTETDIFGAQRIQDGAPEMGAVENLFENRICVSASVLGRGEVSPKFVFVEEGGSATFVAIETAGRVFAGFKIDDEIVTREKTITLDGINAPISVVAVFKSGDLYVSRNGDDEKSGFSWTFAKATIQAAIDESDAGDTIYVGEGVYSPIVTHNLALTIRSVSGAEKTIIDANGMGSCVKIGSYGEQDTKLIGFTLRNGYVLGNGGGALGGTLYDCRVENNCVCGHGGGLAYAKAIRCVISGNKVVSNPGQVWGEGGGAYGCELDNCLVVSNTIYAASDEYARIGGGGVSGFSLYNCTVADNRIVSSQNGIPFSAEGGGILSAACYNTISWNNSITGVLSNAEGAYISDTLWADEDPQFIGMGNYALASNSPCIDVGDNYYAKGDMDIVGNSRILGGTVDLGAYEYSEVPVQSEYAIRFDANGGDGEMPSISVAYGTVTNLPANAFSWVGHMFVGWAVSPNGEVVYRNMGEIVNLVEDDEVTLYACWNTAGSIGAQFVDSEIVVNEGETAIIRISGSGKEIGGGNVCLYLAYNTAAAADIDLKNALEWNTYGTPVGGVKFPWLLTWGDGHVGENVLEIPIKADKAVEGDEFFTLQLADAHGQSLGDDRVCTVTIRDMNDKTLKTTVTPYKPKKGETVATNSVTVASGNAKGGFVSGTGEYTSGSKLTLTAEARPGWAFVGWRRANSEDVVSDKAKWQVVVTNDTEYVAVFEKIPYVRGLADPANAGKVAGSGLCDKGKKVTLKATANKGFVFTGWVDSQIAIDGERLQKGAVEYVATTPSLVVDRSTKPAKCTATSTTIANVTDDATYYACFITSDDDKMSIDAVVDGWTLEPWVTKTETHALRTNIWAGVYLEWPVAASALSEAKVKVAGLPAGLKFTDKPVTSKIGTGKNAITITNVLANTIYGAPTVASKVDAKTKAVKPSEVKLTVTTAGKSTQTYQIALTVDALPAWAQGTFAGGMTDGGQVSLTVSAAGKASGKALGDGLTYTLAAPYYAGFEMTDGVSNFLADVTATWSYKEGTKTIKTNEVVKLVVQDNGVGGYAAADDWFEAYTVNWKVEPWKTLGKSFDKKTFAYAILPDGSFSENEDVLTSALGADVTARVTLKFSASGAVSVAGEFVTDFDARTSKYIIVKATGSATLVPVDDEHYAVFVYLLPKGLPPHARCVEVPLP